MSDTTQHSGTGPRHRTIEAAVAVIAGLLGLIVVIGSLQVGIGWGAEGPKSGFFPFYIGLFIVGGSIVNFIHALALDRRALFAEWSQLHQVLQVVIPTAVYVLILPYSGIYIASTALIALFMKWLGKYSWTTTAAVAIGVPVAIYLMFEMWFLVPLPKGPIEDMLGL